MNTLMTLEKVILHFSSGPGFSVQGGWSPSISASQLINYPFSMNLFKDISKGLNHPVTKNKTNSQLPTALP